MRRLPVYLLLDTSGSMYGDPINAVKEGLQTLTSALRRDPYALETAHISVITFGTEAKQVIPLTELLQFQSPTIEASGTTSLGAALSLLNDCIDKEVVRSTNEVKGDWKPMVFLMTDGIPSDDWEQELSKFGKEKVGVIVACAAGVHADEAKLKKITDTVVTLKNTDAASISAFFKWVSASISSGSQRLESGQDIDDMTKGNELPPPPPEINILFE